MYVPKNQFNGLSLNTFLFPLVGITIAQSTISTFPNIFLYYRYNGNNQ